MTVQQLYQEIQSLSERDREDLLTKFLSEKDVLVELERLGLLRLSDRAFDFWNDPREDVYQDLARTRQ